MYFIFEPGLGESFIKERVIIKYSPFCELSKLSKYPLYIFGTKKSPFTKEMKRGLNHVNTQRYQ